MAGSSAKSRRIRMLIGFVLILVVVGLYLGDVMGLFGSETVRIHAEVVDRIFTEGQTRTALDNDSPTSTKYRDRYTTVFLTEDDVEMKSFDQDVYEAFELGERVILTVRRTWTGSGITEVEPGSEQ